MNTWLENLQHPFVLRLGWTLLHFLWQGAAVGAVAGLMLAAMRRNSPQVRCTALFVLLLVAAACPLGTFIYLGETAQPPSVAGRMPTGDPPVRFTSPAAQGQTQPAVGPVEILADVDESPHADSAPPINASPIAHSPDLQWLPAVRSFLPWLVVAWCGGVTLLALRMLGGWWRARCLVQRHIAPLRDSWQPAIARLTSALNVHRSIRWLESTAARVPLTVGSFRPVIVVPASVLTGLSQGEVECLLAHELAHIRRHDYLANLLQCVIEVLLFYHPVVWWLSARIRREREHACDALAVGVTGDRVEYSRALLSIANLAMQPAQLAVSADGGALTERVRRVLGEPARATRTSVGAAIACIAIVFAAGFYIAATSLAADEPEDTASSGGDLFAFSDDVANSLNKPYGKLPPRALMKLGDDRLRLRGSVRDIAFSPDGKTVAVPDSPWRSVRFFDVATGQQVRRLEAPNTPPGYVTTLAFSPDQSMLICGESDGRLTVWDLASNVVVHQADHHRGAVQDVTFSPDGALLASAGADGTVLLQNTASLGGISHVFVRADASLRDEGGNIRPVTHNRGVASVAFTPNGDRLLAAFPDKGGAIAVWRIRDSRLLRTISPIEENEGNGFNPELTSISITPDGRSVLSFGLQNKKREATSIEYGPNNVTLNRIRVWDIATGEQIRDLHGTEVPSHGYAALSPDGKKVAAATYGKLIIRSEGSGDVLKEIALPGTRGGPVTFSPDGRVIALGLRDSVALFDAVSGERLLHDERSATESCRSAAWSHDGSRIVTGHTDGVRVWDTSNGNFIWYQPMAQVFIPYGRPAIPLFVAFSPDDNTVYAAGERNDRESYRTGVLVVFDASTGEKVREVTVPRQIRQGSIAPDGRLAVVATSNGSLGDTRLHGIEVATGRILYSTRADRQVPGLWSAEAIQFEEDSRRFRVAAGNSEIVRYDAESGAVLERASVEWRTPDQPMENRRRIAQLVHGSFDENATTLLTSSISRQSSRAVLVWDAATGGQRSKLPFGGNLSQLLCISPDGRTVAAADANYGDGRGINTIRLFDVESSQKVLSLEPNDGRAVVLKFSPDGDKLFAGFDRGPAMIWDTSEDIVDH